MQKQWKIEWRHYDLTELMVRFQGIIVKWFEMAQHLS